MAIEPPDTVLLKAPRMSVSARLSDKSASQTVQRFQFSQVTHSVHRLKFHSFLRFPHTVSKPVCIHDCICFRKVHGPETTQKEMFDGSVSPLVKDVLEGKNSLVFTYGVTNAGKTYTFLGRKNIYIFEMASDNFF